MTPEPINDSMNFNKGLVPFLEDIQIIYEVPFL